MPRQQYSDIPAGFQVYSDIPEGFSVAPEAPAPPKPPSSVIDQLKAAALRTTENIKGGFVGAGKAAGEFVQTGGQWMENIAGMPVSAPRTTATGRDVFQANTPQESVGKTAGQVAIGAAAIPAGGPSVAGQMLAGGMSGALLSPDNPEVPAALGMAAPLVPGIMNRLSQLRKTPIVDPKIAAIEQKLRGSGDERILLSEQIAPELAKNPKLAAAKAGQEFDQAFFQEFKGSGAKVRLFEGMMPDDAPVNISEPLRGIRGLQADFAGSASDDAVKALDWAASRLDRFKGAATLDDMLAGTVKDKSMPWGQFIEVKRGLADKMKTLGVFKRISQDVATDRDLALNRAYGQLIEASSAASEAAKVPLAAANKQFSIYSDGMHIARLSRESGRRLSEIVKPPATLRQRTLGVVKKYGPAAALGGAGVAGAGIIREMTK